MRTSGFARAGRSSPEPDSEDSLSAGIRLLEREDYNSALQHLEEAYRREDRPEHLVAFLGFACYRLGQDDRALEVYEEGIRLYPKNDEFWSNHGAIHANAGRYTEALESLRNALALSNTNPETWCRIGHVLNNLGRHKEALLAFDNALHFTPESQEALEGRRHAEMMAER